MNIPDEVRGQVERVVDRPDRDTQSAQRRDDALAAREAREAGASTRAEPAATARPVERPATIVDLSDDAKRYLDQREAAPAAPSEAPPAEPPAAPPAPQAELTQSVSVAASNGRDQQAISEAAQSATTAARLADVAAEESRRPDAPGNDTQNGARIDIQRFRDDLDARMKLGVEARMNPAEITRAIGAYGQA